MKRLPSAQYAGLSLVLMLTALVGYDLAAAGGHDQGAIKAPFSGAVLFGPPQVAGQRRSALRPCANGPP